MKRRRGSYRIPALLGLASLAALIVGLLGDGTVDVFSWIGLALPLAAIGVALARPPGEDKAS